MSFFCVYFLCQLDYEVTWGCVAFVSSGMGSEHRDSSTSLGNFTYLEDTFSCSLKARSRAAESEEGGLTWGCLDGHLRIWVLTRLLLVVLMPWPLFLPCLPQTVLPMACGFPRSLTPSRALSSYLGRRRQGPGCFGLVGLGPTYPCHCLPRESVPPGCPGSRALSPARSPSLIRDFLSLEHGSLISVSLFCE